MIEVIRAPAHLVIQDFGFQGSRGIGLPRAGAMDPVALALGNSTIGNEAGAPALEWAVTGGVIRFSEAATIALTGARVRGRVGRDVLVMDREYRVEAGTILEVERFVKGRFLYLCTSLLISVPKVFRSRSTYTPGRIGGFEGRRLKHGDRLPLEAVPTIIPPASIAETDYERTTLRVVPGPQKDALDGRVLSSLLDKAFTVSVASDRTGYRLEGQELDVGDLPQILSEPACEGAVEITDSGMPIVLMADGPTLGGYQKVAVVVEADLPILAQKTPGETIRFSLL